MFPDGPFLRDGSQLYFGFERYVDVLIYENVI